MDKQEFYRKYKFTPVTGSNMNNILDTRAMQDINLLVNQLTGRKIKIDQSDLMASLRHGDFAMLIATYGAAIVGMGSICFTTKITSRGAEINDMVVDEKYHGEGIGSEILSQLINLASERLVDEVNLTSRPEREQANRMYAKHGFKKRETNVWRLKACDD